MSSSSSSCSSLASSKSEIQNWKSDTQSRDEDKNKGISPEKTLGDIKIEAFSSTLNESPQLWNK